MYQHRQARNCVEDKALSAAKYQVESESVADVFQSGVSQLEVPTFQRPFSWTGSEVAQLVDDLFGANSSQEEVPYFLGSIVLARLEGRAVESEL